MYSESHKAHSKAQATGYVTSWGADQTLSPGTKWTQGTKWAESSGHIPERDRGHIGRLLGTFSETALQLKLSKQKKDGKHKTQDKII